LNRALVRRRKREKRGVPGILRKYGEDDRNEKLTCVGSGADHQSEVDEVERILQ
jgi:hypothetical protein